MTIPDSDLLIRSETNVNPRIRSWKKNAHLNELNDVRKQMELFDRDVESWHWKTRFRFWHVQTSPWKGHLQMHLLDERFVFAGDDWDFLREEFKSYAKPISPLNAPTFFCLHITSIVYGLDGDETIVSRWTAFKKKRLLIEGGEKSTLVWRQFFFCEFDPMTGTGPAKPETLNSGTKFTNFTLLFSTYNK